MTKAADTSTTEKEPDRAADTARQLFVITMFDMSWRLAVVFLVPTLIGVFVDKQINSEPILTLLGMALGVFGSIVVVRDIIKKLPTGGDEKA